MADGCDNVSKRHGACFGTAVPLSDEEIKRLKLQEASFTEEVRADTDQDGLLDRFTYYVHKGSGSVVFEYVEYQSGRSSLFAPTHLESTFDIFIMPDRWESRILQGGIVLVDANADDRSDIITKACDVSSQQCIYHVYLNQNSPKGVPTTSKLMGWVWSYRGGDLSSELAFDADPAEYSVFGAGLRVVKQLQFHPGPARFVRVNGNPMAAIQGDKMLILGGTYGSSYMRYLLSLRNEIGIEFFDAQQQPVGSFTIHQHLPDMPQQTTPAGIPIIHFYDPRDTQYRDDETVPKIPDRTLSELDATIPSLARWWGNSAAESVCRQIVVIHHRYDKDKATIGRADVLPWTVFVSPETRMASTVRHEAAHNLEIGIVGVPHKSLLEPEWNLLSKSNSPVFAFLNENFFMERYVVGQSFQYGHSEDAATELFASLTSDLCEPPSIWADALRRWDEGKTLNDKKQLRSDLQHLLQSYQKLVAQHNSSVDAAQMMKPYLALLR